MTRWSGDSIPDHKISGLINHPGRQTLSAEINGQIAFTHAGKVPDPNSV
jgi:hypothetical protein